MTVELITGGDGTAHISSADDGNLWASVVGEGQYVSQAVGDGLQLTVVDNNNVTLGTGVLWHNGRGVRVASQEPLQVASGSQGKSRYDLVVARYAVGTDGVESESIVVIKGAEVDIGKRPSYPDFNEDSVLDSGTTVSDAPLWAIYVQGLSLFSTERQFTQLPGLYQVYTEVRSVSRGGTGVTTAQAERNRLGLGNTTGALPVANGGTGATDASWARANLDVPPVNHASTSTTYGVGTQESYGHVRITNTSPLSTLGINGDTKAAITWEATAKAIKSVRDSVSQTASTLDAKLGVVLNIRRGSTLILIDGIGAQQYTTSQLITSEAWRDLTGRALDITRDAVFVCNGDWSAAGVAITSAFLNGGVIAVVHAAAGAVSSRLIRVNWMIVTGT